MARYFIRSRLWVADDLYDDERGAHCPSVTVDEHVATDTGIVDVDGNSIMRAPNPIGFGRDEEW